MRQVDLGFRVAGRIKDMIFEEGDFVKKGSYMGELDSQPYKDLVAQARAAIESHKINLENAEKILKRRFELITDGSVAKEELETAQSNRDIYKATLKEAMANLGVALTHLEDAKLYAPNEGVILTRIREPGSVVKIADPIYTLSLLDPVWIRTYIPETYLGTVYPGMKAEIFTDTPGAVPYQGHVGFISPLAEFTPKTVETTQLRTHLVYRLRIIADNPDKGLRQGMPVTVKLYLKENIQELKEAHESSVQKSSVQEPVQE